MRHVVVLDAVCGGLQPSLKRHQMDGGAHPCGVWREEGRELEVAHV